MTDTTIDLYPANVDGCLVYAAPAPPLIEPWSRRIAALLVLVLLVVLVVGHRTRLPAARQDAAWR